MDLLPALPDEPLYRQAYRSLREQLLSGRLPAGSRLPGSRRLARRWGVARNTVLEALALLEAEGFVYSRAQQGTFVTAAAGQESTGPEAGAAPLTAWASRALAGALPDAGEVYDIDFRLGRVPTDLFPSETWGAALARRAADAGLLGYGDERGPFETRLALCDHLALRGVTATPDMVMLSSGSQGSLDALSRLYLEPGRTAAIEDPGYPGARRVFEASGARVVDVPVDGQGLNPAWLPDRAALLYLTPAHQFPTGVLMPAARRLALLDWARRAGAWIIEDDYNSEFRFGSRPVAALQGLAPERVILVGTFSKSLAPALRSGYLVAPRALIEILIRTRPLTDRQPPTLDALALADFLASGGYARHLRRARAHVEARLHALTRALAAQLPMLGPHDQQAGLHLLAELPAHLQERDVQVAAARMGVGLSVLGDYARSPRPPALLLNYAHLGPEHIREGVARLAAALKPA